MSNKPYEPNKEPNKESNKAKKAFYKKKRFQKNLVSSSEVLQSLLQKSKGPLASQFKRWKLWRFWSEVVGEVISKSTMPVSYHNGVLYIWVSNSVRLHELNFVKEPMIKKVNEYIGYRWVHKIVLTLDKKRVPGYDENSMSNFDNFESRLKDDSHNK